MPSDLDPVVPLTSYSQDPQPQNSSLFGPLSPGPRQQSDDSGCFSGSHPQLSNHMVLKPLPVPPLLAPTNAFGAGFQIINVLPAFGYLK